MIETNILYNENCLDTMKQIPDNNIDAVVTDPPYGWSFMSDWDKDVPTTNIWKEVYRILKPGAHMLVACGTRTYHKMVTNIENAGFYPKDMIVWAHAMGFPKSLDISKSIDKELGYKREIIGEKLLWGHNAGSGAGSFSKNAYEGQTGITRTEPITAPSSNEAKQWNGWGTQLKPAIECFALVQKPILEKTITKNVLKYGTGGINIDGCRIPINSEIGNDNSQLGRFPSNLILDDSQEVKDLFPTTKATKQKFDTHITNDKSRENCMQFSQQKHQFNYGEESNNSASRFFYIAKASRGEKNAGLPNDLKNIHPTVKPLALMKYLVRLITPINGIIYDPFSGSGTTLLAAIYEGFNFIGSELESQYCEIAQYRINYAFDTINKQTSLFD